MSRAAQTTWDIDPEHGRVTGPGFLGDSFHSLRVRELLRYYQPSSSDDYREVAPINTGNDFIQEAGLRAAEDPILAAFANLTTRLMDMRRCVVSMTGAGTSYVIAESTRTLSLAYPHTYEPGDALMLGGGVATSSLGGLCEHTCSLLPPPPDSDEPFLLEIPDLSKHPKFYNVGYVRDWPHARFYCGAPLRTQNGVTIGTVCVMDDRTRYDGLTDKERLIMSNMADLFMQYFETKEHSRFYKKGQIMEMELSRFISEGYLPSEGSEILERRNGRLWSEEILQSKRQNEEERKKKVLAKRQMLQEIEYAKMFAQEQNRDLQPACTPDNPQTAFIPDTRTFRGCCSDTAVEASMHQSNILREEPALEEFVPYVHRLQPGVIEMLRPGESKERSKSLVTAHATQHPVPTHPKEGKDIVEDLTKTIDSTKFGLGHLLKDLDNGSQSDFRVNNSSPSYERKPETSASSSMRGTIDDPSEGVTSTTGATSLQSMSTKEKRSKYEESTSLEPHLRAIFARASTVMKNTLDCDVVFIHGDLEGFFEPDFTEDDPHLSDERNWSHVSSDNKSELALRANRPKQQRQKSGILGYATSRGSSSARFEGPKKITDLGFDMSELRQEHLAFLLKDSKGGRIFSFFDEYPGLEEHEDPEELECKRMLGKFLPGCRNVIIVPLHDHNNVLSSVCFAWTCSDQRTFYGDEEGRFAAGVAASLMDEMARMQILSADKAKTEFISSISHELRSPLHGILASAEFLIDDELRPHQHSFVETILSCGTTLLDTVNHVLDFQKLNFLRDEKIARIEAPPGSNDEFSSDEDKVRTPTTTSSQVEENLFDNTPVDTDLGAIVQEVTEGVVLGYEFKHLSTVLGQAEEVKLVALQTPAKISNIQVVVDVDSLEGGWLFRSNPAAFKRIVSNIVGNAIKYSHDSGWIKITLSAKKIDTAPNTLSRFKVVFVVSDSGKGMSREFLKTRLFTPFTQENPMAAGSGLGLSIVRQLVDALGGKIDVKSQLGKGTTIRIEMKLTQGRHGRKARSDASSDLVLSKIRGKKAYLVGFDRFEYCETPEQRGQTLLYESLSRYAKNLLHIELVSEPGTLGADECQFVLVNEISAAPRLREMPILKDRPVIVLCSSTPKRSMLDDVQFDRDPKLVSFLRKPCGPKKLVRAFQVCLDTLENWRPSSTSLSQGPATPVVAPRSPAAAHSTLTASKGLTNDSPGPVFLPTPLAESGDDSVNSAEGVRKPLPSPLDPSTAQLGSLSSAASLGTPAPVRDQAETVTLSEVPMSASPAPTTSSGVPIKPPTRDASPHQPRILCVEDNKINMMLVTTYLKKKKYPFEMAFDGAEAFDKVKEEISRGRDFDCILMDLQMPVMSGIEATREIRALERRRAGKHKPAFIIALTGLAAGSDREEAFNAGVDAFMVKPVSFKDLEKMLKQHVREGVRDAERWGLRTGIVSVESERGKNIEIKKQVISASVEALRYDDDER